LHDSDVSSRIFLAQQRSRPAADVAPLTFGGLTMTDMIELARRLCMGEHIPPLKDGPAPDDAELLAQVRETTKDMQHTLDAFADLRKAMREAGMLL
jgi:hypothetical protein